MENKDTKIINVIFGFLGITSFCAMFILTFALESSVISAEFTIKASIVCGIVLYISFKLLEFSEELKIAREKNRRI